MVTKSPDNEIHVEYELCNTKNRFWTYQDANCHTIHHKKMIANIPCDVYIF